MKLNLACPLLVASLLPLSTLWLRAADTAAPSDQPTTAAQAAQMAADKRQQLMVSAAQAVSDGERLLGSGKYDDAALRFQYAVDALTDGGVAEHLYSRAEAGLAAAKAGQARELAKDNKYAQAATRLQEAINLQPDNPAYPQQLEELKREQLSYEEQVRDPEGTVNNPAVTDDLKSRVATVQKLLFQGDAYFRTGQFDKAEETYSKILILDPYNNAARTKMDHVERYRERADGFRHEEYEQAAMLKVNQGWAEAISPDIVATTQAGPVVAASNRANIAHKLESIIIDKVNFDKLDIDTVVQFLTQKSKELDPDHQGINFVLRLTPNSAATPDASAGGAATPAPATDATAGTNPHPIHREVSITLENVPLKDVLGYIIQQTNLQFSVEDYAVYLRPSIDEGETLSVRTFLVPPSFFTGASLQVNAAAPTDNAFSTVTSVSVPVQQELTNRGIRFPAGATATFLPGSSKLVVRDTPEQLDLIENLIDQLNKETPQIQIEAKFVEFTQEALKSLTFNYSINTGLASTPFSSFGIGTQLRNASSTTSPTGGITPDSIDNLIQTSAAEDSAAGTTSTVSPITGGSVANNAPNTLTVGAILDTTGFAAVMQAINNTNGVSLLSAPSVTTKNGVKANIDIVQEFPYPTSFEHPKLSTTPTAYSAGAAGPRVFTNFFGVVFDVGNAPPLELAIPPTPREFVTQDVGVSLEVKPTTYPDQRIDLSITKAQVIDFEGFIDYGVPIRIRLAAESPAPTSEGTVLTQGTINQPVFNLRSIVTDLQVLDGQTAVLGGLIREDTQEVNDKVPILGDLPLIGRLFQSKVSDRIKKNLMIFVTARLIRSNGKLEYIKTLDAEPEEEMLPEPDQQIGPGVTLPPLPEGGPNS